jgi:DNA-binding MarR family transcriptional regulator
MTVTAPARNVDLMLLLHVASHNLQLEMTARLAELGITPRAHCVLNKAVGEEHTQSELAELANMDKTTMVVTMDALEQAGLAERVLSSSDRRARIVRVTAEGEKMLEKADKVVFGIFDDVLDSLPADQRNGFLSGLRSLAHGRLAAPTQCEHAPRRRTPRVPKKIVG